MNWPDAKHIMNVGKWVKLEDEQERWHEAENGDKAWRRYGFCYLIRCGTIFRGSSWEDTLKGAGYDTDTKRISGA